MKIGGRRIEAKAIRSEHIGSGEIQTDNIADGAVTTAKLAENAVVSRAYILGIYEQSGLAADSTGVKYEGPRFKIDTTQVKSITLRATWTASNTDSETAIELYDVTAGSVIASLSGNAGTDQETSIDPANITSGNLLELRVNVTTASGTSGATTDVKYAILEIDYGAA